MCVCVSDRLRVCVVVCFPLSVCVCLFMSHSSNTVAAASPRGHNCSDKLCDSRAANTAVFISDDWVSFFTHVCIDRTRVGGRTGRRVHLTK